MFFTQQVLQITSLVPGEEAWQIPCKWPGSEGDSWLLKQCEAYAATIECKEPMT